MAGRLFPYPDRVRVGEEVVVGQLRLAGPVRVHHVDLVVAVVAAAEGDVASVG